MIIIEKRFRFFASFFLLAGFIILSGFGAANFVYALAPVALKTEMLTNPVGLHSDPPRLSWIMEDLATGAKQTAYRIQAAGSPDRFDDSDLWDSGKVNSDQSHLVPYGGTPPGSRQRIYWRVQTWNSKGYPSEWSEPAFFEMGLLDPDDWTALWIQPAHYVFAETELTNAWLDHAVLDTPGSRPSERDSIRSASLDILRQVRPLVVTRKTFQVDGMPGNGRLYLSALGFANVYINGEAVFDEWNTPAPTHYKIAARYKVYDISGFLRQGTNSVAVELAAGKYNELPGNHVRPFGDRPLLKLQIEFDEGGRDIVVATDNSWKMGYDPRNLMADFWAGSVVDGSQADAVSPGFDDSTWPAALLSPDDESKRLLPMLIPPEKTVKNVRPVKQWQVADGVWVFDFGRTVIGRVQLDLPAADGRTFIIRYSDSVRNSHSAEYEKILARPAYPGLHVPEEAVSLGLKRRGNILFRNVPGYGSFFTAVPTEVYMEPHSGEVQFAPRYGMVPFRFMEVIGFDGEPDPEVVSANIAHTALERTGSFESSDESLNRIHEAIVRTLLYNAHGFYYDNNGAEKGFWPHTYGMNLPHFAFNCDIDAYSAYILEEVELFTREEGFTSTSISGRRGENEAAKFADLSGSDYNVKLPYLHYLYSGDRKPLEDYLDQLDRFVHEWWFADNFPTLFLADLFGDHTAGTANLDVPESAFLNPLLKGKGSVNHSNITSELWTTIYGTHLLDLAASISDLTGNPEAAAARRAKRDEIREAVREKYYWNPEYGYSVDCRSAQGSNAAMIFFEVAPEYEYPELVRAIREDIKRWSNHISTGSRLTYALFSVLSANGYLDEVVDILTTNRYPSILAMLDYANTLSESWPMPDAPAIDSHCQTEGYTELGKWFWTDLQGILPDLSSPGFKHFFLKPSFPEKITSVASEFQTPYGTVINEWSQEDDAVVWNVTIPWNASATVLLPDIHASLIRLNGNPMASNEFRLDSGSWEIMIMH